MAFETSQKDQANCRISYEKIQDTNYRFGLFYYSTHLEMILETGTFFLFRNKTPFFLKGVKTEWVQVWAN